MMVDNELSTLPNPVATATDDMGAFLGTLLCEVHKMRDPNGYMHVRGLNKDGYCLYMNDIWVDGRKIDANCCLLASLRTGSLVFDRSQPRLQVIPLCQLALA